MYLSKELDPDEQKLENIALKSGCHLIQNENVSSKDLRIRNLKTEVNVRSILQLNRRMTFANAIATNDYDILCISEIWLVQEVLDGALFLLEYNLYRSHRVSDSLSTNHGGVIIAIRGLIHKRIHLEFKHECVIVQVYN